MKNLIPLYKEMAGDGRHFLGLSIVQHAEEIGVALRSVKARTVLDYGCGRGDAYYGPEKVHRRWGIARTDVVLYDPAFLRRATLPDRKFDAVICSDVLEHIPEEGVPAFVHDLFKHAKKIVWASVCCRPANKTFPGTDVNVHVTLHPYAWWKSQFENLADYFPGVRYVLVESP